MPKPKNDPIGECPCPVKGCELSMQVFRFRGRENELQRRLAGKLYGACDEHGRFGADGKPAAQNYLLEHAELWDEKDKAARAAKPKPKSDELTPPRPSSSSATPAPPAPTSTVSTPRRHLWEM